MWIREGPTKTCRPRVIDIDPATAAVLRAWKSERGAIGLHLARGGAVVFGNREHLLPSRSRGYYHEYTVPTPGAHNRGARRIICGGPKLSPEACFYTDDHYRSFRRIRA